jgi:hypothetical protein
MQAFINLDGKLVVQAHSYEEKYAVENAIKTATAANPFYICDDCHLEAREDYLAAQEAKKQAAEDES